VNNNELIIAAAGSGKTTHLVTKALSVKSESVLITTFTEANQREICNRILSIKGYMPSNITVQTWFSFLLQHGVRPYQSVLDDSLYHQPIGFLLADKKSGQKIDRNGDPVTNKQGMPIYWGKDDFIKCYFTKSFKIYSDKISKFVCLADKASKGEVISRISRLFNHIYIDEVQDLAGYDLDLIKALFKSTSNVILVGDPRQVTYLTHYSTKYGKYSEGKIKDFVSKELGTRIKCNIDEETLSMSHRNNQLICNYSAKLFPSLPVPSSCECKGCISQDAHLGVFIIKPSQVEDYLKLYSPMQLRWDSQVNINNEYPALNLGESKGSTMDRVLIYPTNPMKEWIVDNTFNLKTAGRSKLYVGLTRARLSSAIIMDFEDGQSFDGIQPVLKTS
jgi:DNA helicase II / ATP-dependent DNA helicase PcrA